MANGYVLFAIFWLCLMDIGWKKELVFGTMKALTRRLLHSWIFVGCWSLQKKSEKRWSLTWVSFSFDQLCCAHNAVPCVNFVTIVLISIFYSRIDTLPRYAIRILFKFCSKVVIVDKSCKSFDCGHCTGLCMWRWQGLFYNLFACKWHRRQYSSLVSKIQ